MAFFFTFSSIFITFLAFFSLIHNTYSAGSRTLSLKNKICQWDFEMGTIEMQGDEAIIINDDEYFASWTGRYHFSCKFTIKLKDKSQRYEGIYAVIQDLNFRREDDGECSDYVEFSVPKLTTKLFNLKNKNPKKFCGNLSPGFALSSLGDYSDNDSEYHSDSVAPNGYVASGDELAVEIYIARERLPPGQKLVVSIAFTPFKKKCHNTRRTETIECRDGECIDKVLEGDMIQNCPYVSCLDENCHALRRHPDTEEHPKDLIGSGIGTKVTLGAVAAIILILLLFTLCLWLCKRISRRRRRVPGQIRHVAAPVTDPDPDQPTGSPQPSAPVIADIDSKDLPPSYDSLFPGESLPLESLGESHRNSRDT